MLGNSTNGINQLCLRQLYLGTILPIMTYGSVAFWNGKPSALKNTLECTQNKALRFISRAFRTTPTTALEIKTSITPIDITLDYYTTCYATCTRRLDSSNLVICCIPEPHRDGITHPSTPPLPWLPPPPRNLMSPYLIRPHESKAKKTTSTRLTSMAKAITSNTERILPHAEPPWRRSEYDHDIHERIRIYVPENKEGTSLKLEWAEDHANLYDEYKDDSDFMFIYTDGSLSYDMGTRRTGYGVVAYRNGMVIASEKGPLGEHIEAYNTEMKALEAAAKMIHELIHNETHAPPSKIIIATNNTGALQCIFQGSPGKAQSCSTTFRKLILDILDKHKNIQFALTWCPGHFDIEGNKQADHLAKSGSCMHHLNTDYKSLSYIESLHKCE